MSKTCANRCRAERRATVARRLRTARTPALLVTVTVLVAAALIAVLSHIRFGSANTYHATFAEGAGLRAGQLVRIATVPVGKVDAVDVSSDNSVNVTFTVAKTYQLYTSTRALIRHENVVGDGYLEITMDPGELHELPVGATINQAHTATVLDSTAKLTQVSLRATYCLHSELSNRQGPWLPLRTTIKSKSTPRLRRWPKTTCASTRLATTDTSSTSTTARSR